MTTEHYGEFTSQSGPDGCEFTSQLITYDLGHGPRCEYCGVRTEEVRFIGETDTYDWMCTACRRENVMDEDTLSSAIQSMIAEERDPDQFWDEVDLAYARDKEDRAAE